MADKKIVPAHDEVRMLCDIIHYDEHVQRTESAEFRHNKEILHEKIKNGEIPSCHINNGFCEGQVEIHHFNVEYSAGTEVDWNKVKQDVNIDNPDQMPNLMSLCKKHHMGVGTGIHMIAYPAWILQKYMNDKNLALFEATIKHLKEEKHKKHEDKTHVDHHLVNAKANAILKKLASDKK